MVDPTSAVRPTVLITGTSSGIGLAAAVALAGNGWDVVATMRDTTRATALLDATAAAGVAVEVRALDVTDAVAVDRVVAEVVSDHGALDALVNNAGAASVGTVETTSLAEIRATLEVNFFGVVTLTKAVMPHLRATGGRLVTVTSVGGVVGQPFNEAYCAAKFAVEGFMESLRPVASTVGVTVTVVEPGAVSSAFVANAGLDIPAMLAEAGAYEPAMSAYLARTTAQFSSSAAQTSQDAAAVLVDVLQDDAPAFRVQTSPWAQELVGAKLADLDGSAVTGMTATWVR